MGKQIVLISCVSKKLAQRAKARKFYVSTLFKLNLRYAQKLDPDEIFILSAKHGLLSLEQEVDPYEQTLNNMSALEVKQWANEVLEQISAKCSIDETTFIFLAGERYRKYLLPYLKDVKIPLQGLGIGRQLQKLKELIE